MPILYVAPNGVYEVVKFLKGLNVCLFVDKLIRKLLNADQAHLGLHTLDGGVHIAEGDVNEVGVYLLSVHYPFGIIHIFV